VYAELNLDFTLLQCQLSTDIMGFGVAIEYKELMFVC